HLTPQRRPHYAPGPSTTNGCLLSKHSKPDKLHTPGPYSAPPLCALRAFPGNPEPVVVAHRLALAVHSSYASPPTWQPRSAGLDHGAIHTRLPRQVAICVHPNQPPSP